MNPMGNAIASIRSMRRWMAPGNAVARALPLPVLVLMVTVSAKIRSEQDSILRVSASASIF